MHEAKAKLSEYVAESQKERVLITSHGKPVAIVIGVEGEDLEDLLTRSDREFWEMIERVREQPTIPLPEAPSAPGRSSSTMNASSGASCSQRMPCAPERSKPKRG